MPTNGTTMPTGRLFPPPFRIDRLSTHVDDRSNTGSPTPSLTRSSSCSHLPPERKKLKFSSQLGPPPKINRDGTENVDWVRYQSAMKLKSKWEGIYEKFKEAHLAPQDEIYLGRRGKGGAEDDGIRVLRDRGVLRGLEDEVTFGHFIHLDEKAERGRLQQIEDEERYEPFDSDEDELGGWGDKGYLKAQYPEYDEDALPQGGEQSDEEDSREDPELLEFLEAERRRRELMGEESEDEEEEGEDDDVVDFSEPFWDDSKGDYQPEQPRSQAEENDALATDLKHSDGDEEGWQERNAAREEAPEDFEEAQEDENSLDELDLFDDDPDLSAYDPFAIEELIRQENAELALHGKMLVPDAQVADLALTLTRGGPSREENSSQSNPPSSSDTLVNPAYDDELKHLLWPAGVAKASAFSSSSAEPVKFATPTREEPWRARSFTPSFTRGSDLSSSSTKVGSDHGTWRRSPSKARMQSTLHSSSSNKHPHRSVFPEVCESDSDATITPTKPLRRRKQLSSTDIDLRARDDVREAEAIEDPKPTLPAWIPSFEGVPKRKKSGRPRKEETTTEAQADSSHKRRKSNGQQNLRRAAVIDDEEELEVDVQEAAGEDSAGEEAPAAGDGCAGAGLCSKTFCMSCGGSRSIMSNHL